jgi:hypothetical protein
MAAGRADEIQHVSPIAVFALSSTAAARRPTIPTTRPAILQYFLC